MEENLRWGVLGTGYIAKKFCTDLIAAADAELVAVGSRTKETADAFGDMFEVPHRHSSYENLADDPDVDVVYVSTPHSLHKKHALLCLDAGKATVCEKPFAINLREAEEMVRKARERRLFLMEAMWTRFLPLIAKLREMLETNVIGELRMLMADFGFRVNYDPRSRWLDPNLGGGGLLDVGVYPVSLASMLFGPPTRVTGMAHLGETGVDEQSAMILGHERGQLALMSAAVRTRTPQVAYLLGTQGRICVHSPWWAPQKLTVSVEGREDEVIDAYFAGNGYGYEVAEVVRCLRLGKLESEIMPLNETLSIMKTMDEIRAQWGLRYPME